MMKTTWIVLAAIIALAPTDASAAKLRCAKSTAPRAEGYCDVAREHHSKGWVRAKASLDRDSGKLTMTTELETDSVLEGPCARTRVVLRDERGAALATVTMGKRVCRGGKPPGKAAESRFKLPRTVPAAIAKRTASLDVSVIPDGHVTQLFSVSLDEILDAVKIVVAVAAV